MNELLRDVGELDASVFGMGGIGMEIGYFNVKAGKVSPRQETMLLKTILTISREPVMVPTLSG